ncbi:DUF4157 domain-containing protein [Spirosoma sp. BT704]|uniref:DUF4157 domain-containing protein n=2 Tax=Spirosoma validum TaxID=2771355 RepID=A0A927GCZ9_9BACT|nr:DUF4157 domain-containing protein [Spirosoma validum]
MESAMGADFSGVRVHTGSEASQLSQDLNAYAFTHGNDIYFNEGQYNPSTSEGQRLLAHELTHTVQQGASVKRKPKPNPTDTLIQKATAPAPVAALSSEVVDLSGGTFNLSDKVKAEIDAAPRKELDVRVIVKGITEEGRVTIRKDRRGNFNSKSKGSMLLTNAWTRQAGGFYLVFTVENESIKDAYVSNRQNGPKEWFNTIKQNSSLLGGVGLKVSERLPTLVNEFSGGVLKLGANDVKVEVGGFLNASFNFLLENTNKPKIDASATVNIKGVVSGELHLDNTKENLTGEVSLGVDYKDFSGIAKISYKEDGSIDVQGKAAYNANKLSGEISFIATDLQSANAFAKDAIAAAGGKENAQTATPPAEVPVPKEGKKDRALAATGQLQFHLTGWFAGTVNVIVDGKGDITVIGKIAPPAEIELFKQKDWDKELFKFEAKAYYGIPVVGNLNLFANISLHAIAKLGPAKIYNIEVIGTYSTDPTIQKNIQIAGSINISAYAGLRLRAEGGAGIEILSHDLKFGVGVQADVGVQAYADARPTIGWRDPGEFYISGTLEMVAQPMLGLGGDFFIEVETPWWSPLSDKKWTWPLFAKQWPLTDPIGLSATVKDYVLGSGNVPEVEFKKPEFDPSKFMTNMVDDTLPDKTGEGGPGKGEFKEDGTVTKPELPDPKAGKKKGDKSDPAKGAPAKATAAKPDPKAQQEAAKLFEQGGNKLKGIKDPITKADLRTQLNGIEKAVSGLTYTIEQQGSKWVVSSSARGIHNPKPVKFNAILTEADKKADGKNDTIEAALGEIDQEGNQKLADGEVTRAEADQIAANVKRDHGTIIGSITVVDGGETWDFEYIQRKKKKGPTKKKRPKELQGKSTPNLDELEKTELGVSNRYVNDFLHIYKGKKYKVPGDMVIYVEHRASRKRGKSGEAASLNKYVQESGNSGLQKIAIDVFDKKDSNGDKRNRIPDIYKPRTVVGDVKDVASISFDEQMRDNAKIADGTFAKLPNSDSWLPAAKTFDLVVRDSKDGTVESTHVSEPLQQAILSRGGTIYEII